MGQCMDRVLLGARWLGLITVMYPWILDIRHPPDPGGRLVRVRARIMRTLRMVRLGLAMLALLSPTLHVTAQVHSLTLGISVHCPYGIAGCWPEVRDGLERLNGIQLVSESPDRQTDTCDVRPTSGWISDP